MDHPSQGQKATFGLLGFMLGVLSLVAILISLSSVFQPEEKSAGAVIGELAADIKLSAQRALSGAPAPEPVPEPQDMSSLVVTVALCVAGLAVVLGGVGLYQGEPHRLPHLAIGIGLSAIVLQFVFWLAVLICGVALLISLLENFDSITE